MKKICMMTILMILCLFPMVTYQAGENDTTIRIEYMNDTYTNVNIFGKPFSNHQGYVFANEKIAYCVEPGIYIRSDIYHSDTNFDIAHITKDQKENMEFIAYYGYQYPSHQTRNYYLATQQLIWEELGITDILFTTGINRSGQVIPVKQEKDEIQRLLKQHSKKPSFDGQTITVKSGEEKVVEDENQVLDSFSIKSKTRGIEKLSNHKIKIQNTSIGKSKVELEKNLNYQTSMIYRKENSQTLATLGLSSKLVSDFSVQTEGYHIELEKKDAETLGEAKEGRSLEGAVYEVRDENNVTLDKMVTDKNGKATSKDLEAGTYRIKETKASPGYLVDEKNYVIGLNQNKPIYYLTLYEEPEEKTVILRKYKKNLYDFEEQAEANIQFEITDSNGKKQILETNENGEISISLPYGTYMFHQINSTDGYEPVEDFEVFIHQDTPYITEIKKLDIQSTGKIELLKTGESKENITEQIPLAHVQYTLFYKVNDAYQTWKTGITNEEGKLVFDSIPIGSYCIQEHSAPKDYIVDEKRHCFTVMKDEIKHLNYHNQLKKTTITIKKTGEQFEKIENGNGIYQEIPLDNVYFELYQVLESGEKLIDTLKTNHEGILKIERYFERGNYYLKEVKTKENHKLDETKFFFHILEDTHEVVMNFEPQLINRMKKGSVQIRKIDENELPLNNTTFALYTKEHKKLYEETTGNTGRIEMNNIPYGEYYIKEIKSKDGYVLKEETIPFKITEDGQSIPLKITNQKKIYPNTTDYVSRTKQLIIGVTCFGCLLLIVGVLIEKRR